MALKTADYLILNFWIANVCSSFCSENSRKHILIYSNFVNLQLDRMSADMAVELNPYGVAIVSVWPGMVRTEFSEILRDENKLEKMVQQSKVISFLILMTSRCVPRPSTALPLPEN